MFSYFCNCNTTCFGLSIKQSIFNRPLYEYSIYSKYKITNTHHIQYHQLVDGGEDICLIKIPEEEEEEEEERD